MCNRRALVALTTAAVAVLVAGCGSGSDAGGSASGGSSTAISPPATSASPTSSTDPSSASPTTSPSATPTPYPTTATAHTAPWKDKNADFGYVAKAKVVSGGVQFSFDRATWLFANQVPAWNKANPTHQVEAADDYAIGNVSTKQRTFLLRTGAKVFGSIILSDQPEPKRITLAQFVARVNAAGDPVTCWIYHRYGGLDGDVVQLEEQYRP